jgi:hypothetical protein
MTPPLVAGILGLGGPELIIILALLGIFVVIPIGILIAVLMARQKPVVPRRCPHCGKEISG